MSKLFKIIVFILVFSLGVYLGYNYYNSKNVENMNNTEIEEKKVNDFDISFLKLENKSKNIVYSPLSIKYALNMLNDGANRKY